MVAIFTSRQETWNLEVLMVDGTYLQAHQSSTGARKQGCTPTASRVAQAIGCRHGRLTGKLRVLMDKHGRFVRFLLLPGNAAEVSALSAILHNIPTADTQMLLADKGLDSHEVRARLAVLGIIAVIPSRVYRKDKDTIAFDPEAYKARHLIENIFAALKHFRDIATRTCQRAATFTGLLDRVVWFIGMRRTAQLPTIQRRIQPCVGPAGYGSGGYN